MQCCSVCKWKFIEKVKEVECRGMKCWQLLITGGSWLQVKEHIVQVSYIVEAFRMM